MTAPDGTRTVAAWATARVVARMLRLAARVDMKKTLVVVGLVLAEAGAAAGLAASQRAVVDAAGRAAAGGVIAAAVLGAVAHVAMTTGSRIEFNLAQSLESLVDLRLMDELIVAAGRISTIDHLESAEYQDRLAVLRRGVRELSGSCWQVARMAAAVVSLALSLVLLASIDPVLLALGALAVPPVWFAGRGERAVTSAMDESAQETRHEQRLHELCVDPDSAKELWVAGSGPRLSDTASGVWDAIRRRETRAATEAAAWRFAGSACYAVGVIAALAFVAAEAARGRASVGDVVLVIALSTQLRAQISRTVFSAVATKKAAHVVHHYLWLVDQAREQERGVGEPPAQLRSGIALSDVEFTYPGAERPVLRNITITLPAGSVVGLVGVNGAGKTTMVKLLTGMCRPTRGQITVDGTPLADLDPSLWSLSQSGAFQDFVKFPTRAVHTVGLGHLPEIDDERAVARAVERAGATAVIERLPAGYQTQLGRLFDGSELSQGQWQKLAVARGAMRTRPVLLVLDEPTAALDPQAEHDLFESFARDSAEARRRGAITVLVSHRFSTVSAADYVIVLDDGVVAEHGTHTELLGADGEYARLYRLQAAGYRQSAPPR